MLLIDQAADESGLVIKDAQVVLLLLSCSLLSLVAGCGGGGSNAHANAYSNCPALPTPASLPGTLASTVDNAVANEMQTQGIPGMTVSIARNGTILYAQGYGYADLSTCAAMQATAELQIGSVTKQFTAAAILELQNAGLLHIDDRVSTYLPSYDFDPRITLRMLLNHTAGLMDYLNLNFLMPVSEISEPTILSAIAAAPLQFTPGSAYFYSNSNFFVLGSVIEVVTSSSYSDDLLMHVLRPAGLGSTFYQPPPGHAQPYVPTANGPAPAAELPPSGWFFSAGALWSNVQDLATWDAALREGKVIPVSLFALMVTAPSVPAFQQGTPSDYGMGWVIGGTLANHPFVWHNGQTTAYTAFNGVFLDNGLSVAVLANYPVQEDTPLLNLGETLLTATCHSGQVASC